jgi:hypothetical protein
VNPRYLAYCKAHSKTPEEMAEYDSDKFAGGCMTGFLIWSGQMLYKAREEHPGWFRNKTLYDHVAYDDWLQKEVQA